MSSRVRTAARTLFALLGLGFLAWSLVTAIQDPDLTVVPSPPVLAGTVVLVVGGLWAAVLSWSALLSVRPSRTVARGFLVAQLGKYMPGGVWQAVGQVGHAAGSAPGGAKHAATAFVMSVLTQVTAGLTVGAALTFSSATPTWLRATMPLAAVASLALLLQPGLMRRVIGLIPPLARRLDTDTVVPSRRQLLTAWGWGVVTMTLAGVIYLLAYSAPAGGIALEAIPAYALAWTIGFLAVPFPAGLGVREAALLLLLPSGDPTALVAAAAIVRVIYIVGELVAIATTIGPTRRGTRHPVEAEEDAARGRTS